MVLQLGAPCLFVEKYLADRHLVDTNTNTKAQFKNRSTNRPAKNVFVNQTILLSIHCVNQTLCQPNIVLTKHFVDQISCRASIVLIKYCVDQTLRWPNIVMHKHYVNQTFWPNIFNQTLYHQKLLLTKHCDAQTLCQPNILAKYCQLNIVLTKHCVT